MKNPSGKSRTLRRNIILCALSTLLLALAFGLDPDEGMNRATADDLSPPPLIWEAQPPKEKAPDNTYYNKHKSDKQAVRKGHGTHKAIAAQEGAAPPSQETIDNAKSAMPASGGEAEGISAEEYNALRAAPSDGEPGVVEGSPGEGGDADKVDDGAAAKRAPAADNCNYSQFVGKNISTVDFSLFGKRRTRVIYPGQAVTMDFSADRINFEVEKDGTINRVSCY